MSLFSHRFLVVTGKGGVGRSATTAALAVAAAKSGKRACIVEMSGLNTIGAFFGLEERAYGPRPLLDGVDLLQLTPEDCLDDFGRRKLRMGALARLVFQSRPIKSFVDAVPGLADLLQLGKIENLLMEPLPGDPQYDLLVLDAPATGHGLTLLAAARSMAEMTRIGPFFELASIIERFLSDRAMTGIVAVTLPELLPVHETLEMLQSLGDERDLVTLVVPNMVRAGTLPAQGWDELKPVLAEHPDLAVVAGLAEQEIERRNGQQRALGELRERLATLLPDANVRTLPRLPTPSLQPEHVSVLADALLEEL